MKIRIMMFLAVFFGMVMCSVAVAFCGGAKFGTDPFGWILATGMMVGGVSGLMAAALPNYR